MVDYRPQIAQANRNLWVTTRAMPPGVLHPVRVQLQVPGQVVDRLAQLRPPRPLPLSQDGGQHRAPFVLEQLPPLPCLVFGLSSSLGCSSRNSPVSFSAG
jgi:hypothetical protein